MNYELLKKNFTNHGFKTVYFENKNEAAAYLKEQVTETFVGLGGSITAKEMGLFETLAESNQVKWHWTEPGRETLLAAREAKVYICSANGVAATGEIVNIDGTGNRVSMTLFGPEKIYFIVGKNKVTPDLQSAIHRAKNVASPKNAMRFNLTTPCAVNGGDRCYDCNSPQRICKGTVILERPMNNMTAEIIFINEDLGY